MAESLSEWMTTAVTRACATAYAGSEASASQFDAPFQKGSKVQIIRFLGFSFKQSSDDALWAIVGDRTTRVCVKFSRECVGRFDNVHTRSLLSLRGSIIALRWYRPNVSLKAAQLYARENDPSVTGPFAVTAAPSPRLFLEVEAIQLWGCINSSTFWDSHDLQAHLLSIAQGDQLREEQQQQRKIFRKWFALASGDCIRRQLPRSVNRHSALRAVSPRPSRQKDVADTVPMQSWGDFSLSWADDEFGLENAAAHAGGGRPGDQLGRDEDEFSDDEFTRWRSADTVSVAEDELTRGNANL